MQSKDIQRTNQTLMSDRKIQLINLFTCPLTTWIMNPSKGRQPYQTGETEMYTCHLVQTNGTLTNCERLSKAEYVDFISNIYGKWQTIRVENELTGEVRVFTDNGKAWERIA